LSYPKKYTAKIVPKFAQLINNPYLCNYEKDYHYLTGTYVLDNHGNGKERKDRHTETGGDK
jgi:hypothetical protein